MHTRLSAYNLLKGSRLTTVDSLSRSMTNTHPFSLNVGDSKKETETDRDREI